MNGLGPKYGLSPETVAQLAKISGGSTLQPGDPGWSIAGPPPPAPPPPAPPRPGEAGFDIMNPMPPKPPPPAPPPPGAVVTRPDGSAAIDFTKVKGKDAKRVEAVGTPYVLPKERTAMDEARDAMNAPGSAAGSAAGGMPAYVGWLPEGYTVQTHHGMSREETAPMRQHQAAGVELAKQSAEIEEYLAKQKGIADAAYANAHADEERKYQDHLADVQRRKQDYSTAQMDRLRDLTSQAQMKEDPEQFWDKRGGVAGKVGAAIMIGLNQFATMWKGNGQNAALDIINREVDRNVAAQRANAQNARNQVELEGNLYARNMDAFGDQEKALAATKFQNLEVVKTQLDAQMAKDGDQRAKLAGMKIREALEEKQAQEAKVVANAEHMDVAENASERFGMMGGGAAAGSQVGAHQYSEELEKAGIPAQLSTLMNIDRTLDTMGSGEVSGVSGLADYVPNSLYKTVYGGTASARRQSFQELKLQLQHEIAGASLTPGEKSELDVATRGSYDTDSLRRTVQAFRQKVILRQRNIMGGQKPENIDLYERQGGSVKRHDLQLNKPTTPYQRPVGGAKDE